MFFIKKDINDIKYGLNEVMKLKPKCYRMIDDDLEQIGFIAQDVEEVLPELVTRDINNNVVGIKYTKLTAYLIEAIKTLSTEIDKLKQK